MSRGIVTAPQSKISQEFAARLGRLKSGQKIRAILLLQSHGGLQSAAERVRSRHARQEAITLIRQSSGQALDAIDRILERFGGKRLADVNALGSIPVETTLAGISALAASDHVRTILEDQPISLLARAEP